MSNNELDIHMSDLDEETKRILAEADSDDSKESIDKKYEKNKNKKANDDYNTYETNTTESPDSEW